MSIPPQGAVIAERFVVEALVGRGGMGSVLRARDGRLGRLVAIKFLPAVEAGNETFRKRFLREARAAAAVSHPNIIQVHDVDETDAGDVYVVMELVHGRTLRSLMEGAGLPFTARARAIVEVARALASAHRMGLVHRDVKPDNVMVRDDGRVVVLDFGIAKQIVAEKVSDPNAPADSALTQPGTLLGTPAYLSPEQIGGADVDGRADQFALAVTAYELFSGRKPWVARQAIAVMGEILTRDAPKLGAAWPTAPAGLDAVLAKALARQRNARYPDLDAFADALEPYAGDAQRISLPPAVPETSAEATGNALEAPAPADATRDAASETAPMAPAVAVSGTDATALSQPSPAPRDGAPASATSETRAVAAAEVTASRRSWRIVSVAAVVTCALAGAALAGRRAPRAARSPLVADATSALACPPFVVAGSAPEPTGWLGAAAAASFCRRAAVLLGGSFDRVRMPAELADLPRQPSEDFPRAPFDGPEARAAAVRAARTRAAAWIDGTVRYGGDGFHVSAVLRRGDGAELARADGDGPFLHRAVRDATAALVRAGALPGGGSLRPDVVEWRIARDRASLLAWFDFEQEEWQSRATAEGLCREADAGRRPFGAMLPYVRAECRLLGMLPGAAEPVAVDRGTPGALAATARYHVVSGGAEDPRALAAELHRARAGASGLGASLLAEAEAEMFQTLREPERTRELALESLARDPREPLAWGRLVSVVLDEPSAVPTLWAHAAWMPESPVAWRWLSIEFLRASAGRTLAERATYARRAYVLSPDSPSAALQYAKLLVATGERDGARAVASHLREVVPEGRGEPAETIAVALEIAEARFEAALARTLALLTYADGRHMGSLSSLEPLMDEALELAAILDRRAEVADRLIDHFLGPELRLERFGGASLRVASWCAAASPAAAARCRARLDGLLADRFFFGITPKFDEAWRGVTRALDGDLRGAVDAWRPLVRSGDLAMRVLHVDMVSAFDRAGEADLGEAVDATFVDDRASWGGATLADVTAARRAALRGDAVRARVLAETVVRAWNTADRVPAAVAEMRALAAAR